MAHSTVAPDATGAFPHWESNRRALVVALFLLSSGFGLTLTFIPLYFQALGVTHDVETWAGLAVGGYFGLSFLLTPIWGALADHFGRKIMAVRAGLGMGVLYSLLPFAPSPGWLLAIFTLAGAAHGFTGACQAFLAATTPVEKLGRSLAWLQTGNMLGNALGPLMGAALAFYFRGYRPLMRVAGAAALLAGLTALAFTRENHVRPAPPFRVQPVRDLLRLLRVPHMPMLYCVTFVYAMTLFGGISVISVFMAQLVEESRTAGSVEGWVSAASVAVAVAGAFAAPLWGLLLDRIGPARMLAICLLAGAMGAFPVAIVSTPLQLVMARAGTGFLLAGLVPASISMIKRIAPPDMEARAFSYGMTFGWAGMGGGPLLAGIIGPWLGLRSYFALNGVVLLLVFLAGLSVWPRPGETG